MQKFRALIVDDEVHARKGIRTLLSRDADIEIVGECSDGRQAIETIGKLDPDIVFLDIQMPHKNGFEVLGAIDPQQAPVLVFVTAWDNYALKAFEVNAIDYLLKPFTDERFYQSVDRAKENYRLRRDRKFSSQLMALVSHYRQAEQPKETEPPATTSEPLKRFLIKSSTEVNFVSADDVDWLEADGYYTKVHAGNKTHLLRGNLGSFESRLDPKKFARIHRSAVVNLSHVQRLRDLFHGDCLVVMKNGTELKVSRRHRQQLETLLEQLS
jgi:two-component system LytT family response regulator